MILFLIRQSITRKTTIIIFTKTSYLIETKTNNARMFVFLYRLQYFQHCYSLFSRGSRKIALVGKISKKTFGAPSNFAPFQSTTCTPTCAGPGRACSVVCKDSVISLIVISCYCCIPSIQKCVLCDVRIINTIDFIFVMCLFVVIGSMDNTKIGC